MTEKNILAYFKSPEEAEKCAQQLKNLGVETIDVTRFSKYAGDGIEEYTNPIAGNISSLANLTLHADVTNRNLGPLLAADVSASGMSDGGQDAISGRDILLTAVVDEAIHKQALEIVERSGGLL